MCEYAEQIKMTKFIKKLHTAIFTGPKCCEKSQLVLNLIQKEYKKHFDDIIMIFPTLRSDRKKAYDDRHFDDIDMMTMFGL